MGNIAVESDWPADGHGGCAARNHDGAKCSIQWKHTGTPHRFCGRHPHGGYCVAACFSVEWQADSYDAGWF